MPQRIAVIGAGVLGLAVAQSLSRRGAQVTVFDKSLPGSGTSQISYAWVNANGKEPGHYHELNAQAINEHKRWQASHRAWPRWLLETGSLEWAADESSLRQLTQRAAKLATLDYPVEKRSRAALLGALPGLRLDPRIQHAWFFPSECLLYPSLFIASLLADLRASGGQLVCNNEVTTLTESGRDVHLTLASGDEWRGDQLVLATGRWAPELISQCGLELAMTDANRADPVSCSFLAQTQPLPIPLNCNLITPELNVRPDGGGRLMLQALDLDQNADPSRPASPEGQTGKEMLRRLRRLFNHAEGARIERIETGQRSRPADGLPALGYISDSARVYLMVSHSGMTLAPLLGRLVAEEMLSGTPSPMLSRFTPHRLLRPLSEVVKTAPAYLPAAQ
ncbi:NAD(P)/FAD-dependent oxidoreductase [Pantoea vagans]|uniref:NAD(P)/FAD-dependent oxidoreductase n=1 Tax=Pantoea vagans TaxID=470934 RepID=UPI001093A665|nr:FAD-binding oxidoreductase [Pantoea vagans]QCA06705.1 FAD-binding oxidoreductase [Pantoea vagans]